jgi:hypothetical protein
MSEDETQEKVHESGLPKPPPNQLAHHHVHTPREEVEEKQVEQQEGQL